MALRSNLLRAVRICPVAVDDLQDARKLLLRAYRTRTDDLASATDALRARLQSPAVIDVLRGRALLMARLDGTPLAVAGWHLDPDASASAQLGTLAVDPLFAGLGLGRLIIERVEASARRAEFAAIVAKRRPATDGFFARLGYAASGAGTTWRKDLAAPQLGQKINSTSESRLAISLDRSTPWSPGLREWFSRPRLNKATH